jgi:hypothetical protein
MKRLRSGTGYPHPDETPPCVHPWKKKAGGVASGERADHVQIVRGTRGSAFANSRR